MAKLKVECSRAPGESAATSSTIGRLLSPGWTRRHEDGEKVRHVLHDGKWNHQISCVFGTRISPWSWLGPSLPHTRSAKTFTSYIAESQCQAFLNSLSSSGSCFFSFLMDGTTDAGNQKDKLIALCTASRMLLPKRSLHALATWQSTPQEKLMQMVYFPVLMRLYNLWAWVMCLGQGQRTRSWGQTSASWRRHRASVNGDHTGLKAQMQVFAMALLVVVLCSPLRICKNAFSSSLSTNIVKTLLRLFYIYEKSPKKSHQLTNIVDDLREKLFSMSLTAMVPTYTI